MSEHEQTSEKELDELPTARPKKQQKKKKMKTSAARPKKRKAGGLSTAGVRFGFAGLLRWSDRLAGRVVGSYDNLFKLEGEDVADIYLNMGKDLADDEKCEAAAEALKKTLKIEPDNAAAWFQLGIVHLHQQASGAALKAFEKARAVGMNGFDLHFRMAEALSDLGDNEAAVDELQAATDEKPEEAEAFYRLGVALDKLKSYEQAVTAFEKAIELSPREVGYYQSLGFTLEGMGRRDEALDAFKRGVELERRFSG